MLGRVDACKTAEPKKRGRRVKRALEEPLVQDTPSSNTTLLLSLVLSHGRDMLMARPRDLLGCLGLDLEANFFVAEFPSNKSETVVGPDFRNAIIIAMQVTDRFANLEQLMGRSLESVKVSHETQSNHVRCQELDLMASHPGECTVKTMDFPLTALEIGNWSGQISLLYDECGVPCFMIASLKEEEEETVLPIEDSFFSPALLWESDNLDFFLTDGSLF